MSSSKKEQEEEEEFFSQPARDRSWNRSARGAASSGAVEQEEAGLPPAEGVVIHSPA